MKKILLIAFIFTAQLTFAQEEEGIKKSIQIFFEGLNVRDTLKMQSVCDANIRLQTVNERKGVLKLTTENPENFYKSVAAIPTDLVIEEKLLEIKIQVDGAMAHVWTPYEFSVNGSFSHRGVNSFQLFKDNGTWKIVYIIDTRRRG